MARLGSCASAGQDAGEHVDHEESAYPRWSAERQDGAASNRSAGVGSARPSSVDDLAGRRASPRLSAAITFPRGGRDRRVHDEREPPSRGRPIHIGLTDIRRSRPPNGATSITLASSARGIYEMQRNRPSAAACSAQRPMRPRCPTLRSVITAAPSWRALAMPMLL